MAAKMPEMSPDFARWYFELFMDEGDARAARWKGVTELAGNADHQMVEVLVRLAFAGKAPAGHKNEALAAAHGKVVAAFAANPSFDANRSERELQVLAAATLVRLFASDPDAALTVTTASFGGTRSPALPMNLAGLAKQALLALSSRQHERPDPDELRMTAPTVDFAVEQATIDNHTSTMWKGEVEKLRDEVIRAIRSLVDRQNDVVLELSRRIELDEEELQMLWWLTGGHSRLLDRPFGKLEAPLIPLSLGYELGEMTSFSPGPASIRAILAKAGVGSKQVKVADAVNAVALDWAGKVSSHDTVSQMTTPLHFALEKRAEIGDDGAWQTVWAAQTGLPAEVSLPAVEIAELFYREHLFLHLVS